MSTPISTASSAGWHRGRSGIWVAVLAIVVLTLVAMVVVQWQGSSGGGVAPATPSVLMPAEAPASTGDGAPAGAGAYAVSGEQQVQSDRPLVPSRPSCETGAYPTSC